MIKAIAFDLDGLLVNSEPLWVKSREIIGKKFNYSWSQVDQAKVMGMSTAEWSIYMSLLINKNISAKEIAHHVILEMKRIYIEDLTVLEGANEALNLNQFYDLALTTGSPKTLINIVLNRFCWMDKFKIIVSGDEVEKGKPNPDIYIRACQLLIIQPNELLVIEDSSNGIESAYNAKVKVIAIPNKNNLPMESALQKANLVLESLADLDLRTIRSLDK